MPTFPQYEGEVPQCLSLLNLRHYFLLIYWVYFRPTALKYYLYQADSQMYCAEPGSANLLKTWKIPAYRNLYLIFPLASLLCSLFLELPILLGISRLNQTAINWLGWSQVTIIVFFIAICFFNLFWVGFGNIISIPRGIIGGVISATTTIVPIYLIIATFIGLKNIGIVPVGFNLVFFIFFGSSIGIAISIPIGIIISGFVGGLVGIVTGIASGILGAIAFGLVETVLENEPNTLAILFSACLGLSCSAAFGVALSIARCSMTVSLIAIAVGTSVGINLASFKAGFFAWLIINLGGLRFHFYLLELGLILFHWLIKSSHPLHWDNLVMFPLPGTQKLLIRNLARDETKGLKLLATVAANPFQRWQAQKALKTYLNNHQSPLEFLYSLLDSPLTNSYISAPFTPQGWEQIPAVKKLLLGEISNQWVDCYFDAASRFMERNIYNITEKFRDCSVTPLIEFARFLYQLDYKNITADPQFQLTDYQEIYSNLQNYPGGQEIKQTFETMVSFLSCHELWNFPEVIEIANNLTSEEAAIRPNVITSLILLQEIGNDIVTYLISRVWTNKQTAILRATTKLESLEKNIIRETVIPEYKILELIIKQWNNLILPESKRVADGEIKGLIPNPYIAGNPVRKELFIGRADLMRTLREILGKPGQCPSVILYGHRRMGKSSILQNLEFYLDDNNTLFVDCNMHLFGSIDNTGQLLYLFALEIYYKFIDVTKKYLQKPNENAFFSSPYQSFRHFIDLLDRVREGKRFIIMIDEFEEIEELLEQGKLDPQFLKFWRAIFQTYHWLIIAFAGLYTLQEMTTDYWNPLFASVQLVPVSFLHPDEARQLIQNPIPIEYTPDAIDNIIYLTNGQPYLIQLIGKALVTYFNNQTYLHGRFYKDIKFTVKDVTTIINSDELFSAGNGYFQGVWSQAQSSQPEGQLEILKQLSHHPLSVEDLALATGFTTQQVEQCIKTLVKHDVIKQNNNFYEYTVELMRRWVEKQFSNH